MCSLHVVNFRQIFKKKKKFSPNYMKIPPAGAELFRADGRTDMTKLSHCSPFCERAPKLLAPSGNRTTYPVHATAPPPPVGPAPRWVQFNADCPHAS